MVADVIGSAIPSCQLCCPKRIAAAEPLDAVVHTPPVGVFAARARTSRALCCDPFPREDHVFGLVGRCPTSVRRRARRSSSRRRVPYRRVRHGQAAVTIASSPSPKQYGTRPQPSSLAMFPDTCRQRARTRLLYLSSTHRAVSRAPARGPRHFGGPTSHWCSRCVDAALQSDQLPPSTWRFLSARPPAVATIAGIEHAPGRDQDPRASNSLSFRGNRGPRCPVPFRERFAQRLGRVKAPPA